jgi:glycosyltransferase involved in cell wall biosynthesis
VNTTVARELRSTTSQIEIGANEKTRILYVISSLNQGGAERHLVDLVSGLDSTRWETEICVLKNRVHFARELPTGQPRYVLGSPIWASPVAFGRLVAAIRSFRPHIVHAYMNDANLWARLAGAFSPRDKPRILTSVHLDDMSTTYRWLEQRLARRSARIVAHSESIRRLLVDDLALPEGLVCVIPNGVEEGYFRPASSEERQSARRARGFGDGQVVALMPARIAPQKNQDLVVDALARLKASGVLPGSFRLLLAGRVSSARYDRKVRSAVSRASLDDHVQFLGAVSDMRELYAAADVVLMPSRTEASPIAALEALACGIPILISAPANTDDVMVPRQHGWQIESATADSIATALVDILATPIHALPAKGIAGRKHVLSRFTRSRVVDDFARLYRAIK